LHKGIIQ